MLSEKSISIPTSGYEQYIIDLATHHNISYEKTGYDELADTFTRLSDDDVEQDDVERLIIALRRAGVLDGENMLLLLHGYLRETLNV